MQWMIRLVATGLLLAVTATGGVAFAQVPQTLNYQGYLTDGSGQALQDSVVVEFSIYTVESGGVPIWSEFQDVFPSQGLFTTSFGHVGNPFPAGMFDTPLYLGVKVSTDDEMTPRTALSSAAFSMKALDSETLSGFTSWDLDQSGDIATLNDDLSLTQLDIASVQSTVGLLDSDLSDVLNDIAIIDSDVVTLSGEISVVQTDVAGAEIDIAAIESTLQTKQNNITQSCVSGSSIRQVFSSGSVTCEVDDASHWELFNNNLYFTTGNIGIGTTSPAATIQIDAPAGLDPFRARVASSTKLRVNANGSVSVGTSTAGPDDGLYVRGDARFGSGSSTARMTITDTLWHAAIDNSDPGGDDWFIGSSATAWAAGGGKFIISPSDSSTNSALLIDSNKDVGIGITDPLTRLHLGGGSDVSAAGGGYLTVGGITGANIAIDSNEIMARSNGNVAALALNAEGGEVRVNSSGVRDHDSLEVRGRVYFDNGGNSGMRMTATNSNPTDAVLNPTLYEEALIGESAFPFWRVYSREFYAQSPLQYKTYSDRLLKGNIATIGNAMKKIKQLEGVSYALTTNPMGKRKRELTKEEQFVNDNQLGFIAQDVAKVLPQLVTQDESSGLKTVAYMGLIPVLVEALKEQQNQIDELKARLK